MFAFFLFEPPLLSAIKGSISHYLASPISHSAYHLIYPIPALLYLPHTLAQSLPMDAEGNVQGMAPAVDDQGPTFDVQDHVIIRLPGLGGAAPAVGIVIGFVASSVFPRLKYKVEYSLGNGKTLTHIYEPHELAPLPHEN